MSPENKDQPWISNYPPLHKWLDKHGALCMWQVPYGATKEEINHDGKIPTLYVECWQIGRRPFIVVVYANQGGWDIFTAVESIAVTATLQDAEKRLGIEDNKQEG